MPSLHAPELAAVRTVEPSFMVAINSSSDNKSGTATFNAANFNFDIPNSSFFLQQVTKIVPVLVRISHGIRLSPLQPTYPQIIYVTMDGTVGGNVVDARTGVAHEVLCALPVETQNPLNALLFNAQDMFLWDLDYHTPRDISRISVRLLDEKFNPIYLDPLDYNEPPQQTTVSIVLKCFHRAFVR